MTPISPPRQGFLDADKAADGLGTGFLSVRYRAGCPDQCAGGPHTNLSIYGATAFGVGGAIEMAAGYEGKGKGAAGGGVSLLYRIFSQHLGFADSESLVAIQWRHNIGSEGTCMY